MGPIVDIELRDKSCQFPSSGVEISIRLFLVVPTIEEFSKDSTNDVHQVIKVSTNFKGQSEMDELQLQSSRLKLGSKPATLAVAPSTSTNALRPDEDLHPTICGEFTDIKEEYFNFNEENHFCKYGTIAPLFKECKHKNAKTFIISHHEELCRNEDKFALELWCFADKEKTREHLMSKMKRIGHIPAESERGTE